ncbi:MAG: hypothetical protein ACFFG0_10710, partial [Candidatus Thorarchaeota archaeon]
MESDKPIPFLCVCGNETINVVREKYRYVCPSCDLRYFIIYTPFDIFAGHEKFQFKKRDPRMQNISARVSALRTLNSYKLVSGPSIDWFRSQGCMGIHAISRCMNYWMKYDKGTGYKLLYRRPIKVLVTKFGSTQSEQ